MVIDFHTHIFPAEIAKRAVSTLSERSRLVPETDGTADDTLKKMDECGIDSCVCLNIATKPSQMRKINAYMKEISSERLIPFGTIHPDGENAIDELDFIKECGFKGIKLHPDYQNFYADEKRMYDIYLRCCELELLIIFHSGYDIGLGCPIHCTPLMLKNVSERFPKLKIVAAHFGGYGLWHDVEELLGSCDNVFFDTAFSLGLDKSLAEKLINKKGAEKILLASDCPWESPKHSIEFIESLNITSKEKDLIFGENAKKLLCL